MPLFHTKYDCPNLGLTFTTIWARDRKHARETVALRKMGETIEDEVFGPAEWCHRLPSEILRDKYPNFGHAVHAMIWVAMIELRRNPDRAWEIMCDTGILHEMAHFAHSREFGGGFAGQRGEVAEFIQRAEAFERSVPGVHPSWAQGERKTAPPIDPGYRYIYEPNFDQRGDVLNRDKQRMIELARSLIDRTKE